MPKIAQVGKAKPAGGRAKPPKGGWPGNNGKIGGEKNVNFPLLGKNPFKGLQQLLMLKMLMDMGGGSDSKVDYGSGNSYGAPGYYPGTYGQYTGAPSAAPGSPQAPSQPSIPSQMSATPHITPEQAQAAQTYNEQYPLIPTDPNLVLTRPPGPFDQPTQPGPNGYTPSPTAGGPHKPEGVPDDQWEFAKTYGSALGVDPMLLLAIGKHETDFGQLGAGRQGYTLGFGYTDSGPVGGGRYVGPQNQYKSAAEYMQKHGIHGLQDLLAGKAGDYATDPGWESGVASAYKSLAEQLGGGAPLPPAPPPKEDKSKDKDSKQEPDTATSGTTP